jgi:multidrug efflux pump subunit AcrA (membrane-fusion protein)
MGVVLALALVHAGPACDAGSTTAAVPTATVATAEAFVRRVEADGYLEASEATPVTAPQDSETPMKIAWIAEEGVTIAEGEVVVRFDPTDMQRQLEDSQGDLDSALLSMKKERETGSSALTKRDQAAAQAVREIESARELAPVEDGVLSRNDMIDAQIDIELAKAKAEHAQEVKRVERAASQSKVELLAISQRQAQNEVKRAQDALTRLEVKAPNAGVLVLERNWRGQTSGVGDTVWPGQKLAELPDVANMQAALFVLEADAGDLEEGLSAEVVIEAHPERTYPAKIKRIDALAQPRHHEVPVQYFGVLLEFDATDIETMKVGQRVRATLFIEQTSALVLPRQAVFEEEGRFFVHRAKGQGFERAEVELGPSSAGRVVIERGIEAGDEVALRDPKRSADDLLDASKSAGSKKKGGTD